MKLKPIKSNMAELHLDNGIIILFSYETPVAYIDADNDVFKTATKYSQITSKHINQWTGKSAETVPQSTIDNLLK